MRDQPASRQGLQAYFSAEPIAQERPRLERRPRIAAEPLSAQDAVAVCSELEALKIPQPYELPPARRSEPTAAGLYLAELRRDPEKLRKRLHELTGNPNAQQALLQSVREIPAGT